MTFSRKIANLFFFSRAEKVTETKFSFLIFCLDWSIKKKNCVVSLKKYESKMANLFFFFPRVEKVKEKKKKFLCLDWSKKKIYRKKFGHLKFVCE